MPSRKGGVDKKLNLENVLEALRKLDSEEQLLAGLYFYESLTIEEISLILQKSKQDIRMSLEAILSRVSKPYAGMERTKTVASEMLR